MKKKIILLSMLIVAVMSIVLLKTFNSTKKLGASVINYDTYGKIHFISVTKNRNHNADAILLESQGTFCLIDTGNPEKLYEGTSKEIVYTDEDGQKVADYIHSLGATSLDCIIVTHNHTDHIGGMKQLSDSGLITSNTKYFYREFEDNNDPYKEDNLEYYNIAMNEVNEKGAQLTEVTNTNVTINLTNFTIQLLNTESWSRKGNQGINTNEDNNSIAALVTIGNKKILLTSDMQAADEIRLKDTIGKVDVLQLGNHGSYTSSNFEFLDVMQPSSVIVSGSADLLPVDRNAPAVKYIKDKQYADKVYYTSKVQDAIVVDFDSSGSYVINNSDGVTNIDNAAGIQVEATSGIWTKITHENDSYGWYIFNQDGTPQTGWYIPASTKIYYLHSGNGVMLRGINTIDGKKYYFSKNKVGSYLEGQLITGWYNDPDDSNKRYYLNPNTEPKGQMAIGFYNIDNKWYYFNSNGVLQTSNVTIDDMTYTIGSDGEVSNFNGLVAKPSSIYCINNIVYDGTEHTITNEPEEGYTFSGNLQTSAGQHTVTASLSSGYAWENSTAENVTFDCSIQPTDISSATVTAENQAYTGTALTPVTTVIIGSTTLVENVDYTAEYSDNINVGTATVTITGKGNYTGTATGTFIIEDSPTPPTKVDKPTTSKCSNPTYNGTNQIITESAETGYTFINNSYKDAGSYTVIAKLSSGYVWQDDTTTDYTFECSINAKDISSATVTVGDQTYTGSELTPDPTVTIDSITLTKETDYTVSYSNNIEVGTATVTITGKGNYTGTATGTFVISKLPIPEVEIIDTTNVKKEEDTFIIKIPTGTKLTRTVLYEVLSISNDYTLKDKNNNDITAINQGVGTNSKIVSDDRTYKIVVRGDINGDGELSIIDLINVYGYMNEIDKGTQTTLNQNQITACDFNGDNKVDILDLINVYNRMKIND